MRRLRLGVDVEWTPRGAHGYPVGMACMSSPLGAVPHAIDTTMRAVLGAMAGALPASLNLGRRFRRALQGAARTAGRPAHHDLRPRGECFSNAELGELRSAFEDMVVYQARMAKIVLR